MIPEETQLTCEVCGSLIEGTENYCEDCGKGPLCHDCIELDDLGRFVCEESLLPDDDYSHLPEENDCLDLE